MVKILIIDDEEGIVCTFKELLEIKGFEVADSGVFLSSRFAAILDIIKKFNPEIILLDHILGELSGLEIIKDVQKNAPTAIIVSISSIVGGFLLEEDYRKNGVFHFPGKNIRKVLGCVDGVCLCRRV